MALCARVDPSVPIVKGIDAQARRASSGRRPRDNELRLVVPRGDRCQEVSMGLSSEPSKLSLEFHDRWGQSPAQRQECLVV